MCTCVAAAVRLLGARKHVSLRRVRQQSQKNEGVSGEGVNEGVVESRAKAAAARRRAGQTDKRRKMREDLDQRERAFAAERSEEDIARARLKVRSFMPVQDILVFVHRCLGIIFYALQMG